MGNLSISAIHLPVFSLKVLFATILVISFIFLFVLVYDLRQHSQVHYVTLGIVCKVTFKIHTISTLTSFANDLVCTVND